MVGPSREIAVCSAATAWFFWKKKSSLRGSNIAEAEGRATNAWVRREERWCSFGYGGIVLFRRYFSGGTLAATKRVVHAGWCSGSYCRETAANWPARGRRVLSLSPRPPLPSAETRGQVPFMHLSPIAVFFGNALTRSFCFICRDVASTAASILPRKRNGFVGLTAVVERPRRHQPRCPVQQRCRQPPRFPVQQRCRQVAVESSVQTT